MKKDIKLIRFLFINLYYYILSYLFTSNEDVFKRKSFKYLKCVEDLDKKIKEFSKEKVLNNYFGINQEYIVDDVPRIFIKNFLMKKKLLVMIWMIIMKLN